MSESEPLQCTAPELAKVANSTVETLIRSTSRKIYDFAYERFLSWSNKENVSNYHSENVMLAYFTHLRGSILELVRISFAYASGQLPNGFENLVFSNRSHTLVYANVRAYTNVKLRVGRCDRILICECCKLT